jgi:hypothetical protein
MTETDERIGWSFPEGSVGHDESVKGYTLEATDRPVGHVSWASYAPGESYMVASYHDGDDHVHHVIPAGAVESVDHERRLVTLRVTVAEVKATPTHDSPEAPVEWPYDRAFDRGMLEGGCFWPYTDA